MQIFPKIAALKAFLREKKANAQTIGLVPTMGALHAGHLQLVKSSKSENDITVASIYVNPTQFNNSSDLAKYPRTLDLDKAVLEKAGCDAIFVPDNAEMYPKKNSVSFDFGSLDKDFEGKSRPGHFSGVALVVSKFFNIVEPDRAYFGQKDYQQFKVISRLVDELQFNVLVKCIPTLREPDGLAMSSRNLRLSEAERKKATILYNSLTEASTLIKNGQSLAAIKETIRQKWSTSTGIKLDYFEAANRENLIRLDNVNDAASTILLIAGFIGEVRLIDNLMPG